jgi:RNA polymerase sigma-70 factor (ECF subfamily)
VDPLFDEAWHERALAGDPAALASFVETHYAPLLAYCLRRASGDAEVCRDVVQDAFVRAVERLDRYRPARCGGRPFTWLAGLARNEMRRALARTERSLDAMDADALAALARIDAEPFSDELLNRAESSALVEATMARLSPGDRAILAAKYVEGASVRILAARLALDEGAVESRLTRARARFRETFAGIARRRLDDGRKERRPS